MAQAQQKALITAYTDPAARDVANDFGNATISAANLGKVAAGLRARHQQQPRTAPILSLAGGTPPPKSISVSKAQVRSGTSVLSFHFGKSLPAKAGYTSRMPSQPSIGFAAPRPKTFGLF